MRMSADMKRKEAKRIGDNIAWLMTVNGISKKRVGEYLGRSMPTVYDRLKDARLWTLDELFALCNLFNCGLDQIVGNR